MNAFANKTFEPLAGKTLAELHQIALEAGLKSYGAKQLASWLYKKYAVGFEQMSDIPARVREWLIQHYIVGWINPVNHQQSADGTIKYLFETKNKWYIESAWIPESSRSTLCVSSQAGCRMGCRFCMTARQGFQDQLTSGEILNQLVSIPQRDQVTNMVYMGMGEPLDNIENVLKSLEILTAGYGFGWSYQRITVSTIGIIPGIRQFLEKSQCHLAVSLHSPYDEQRQQLIPMQKTYPVKEILNEIRKHDFTRQRRISFEYIMFKGINDTEEHARELIRLLNGIPCRINLISFHSFPGCEFESSSSETIQKFSHLINSKGITCTIRKSRGNDISAACGLLSTKELTDKQKILNQSKL